MVSLPGRRRPPQQSSTGPWPPPAPKHSIWAAHVGVRMCGEGLAHLLGFLEARGASAQADAVGPLGLMPLCTRAGRGGPCAPGAGGGTLSVSPTGSGRSVAVTAVWQQRGRGPGCSLREGTPLASRVARGSQAPRRAVCGTRGSLWTMHGPPRHAHGDLTSLAPHERLPEIMGTSRGNPGFPATPRERPRAWRQRQRPGDPARQRTTQCVCRGCVCVCGRPCVCAWSLHQFCHAPPTGHGGQE